ncbi:hypothetical protein L1987_67078 [Smallanthus sonchifolius]|uniref:Uncharacterized protein n=1 Tax=Smallanthus sonchifolius TaxID=185202 RepID=A0ACB9BYW3_9ASTR|nr:hypothetical protein L1987_67078 [Smallanthus sonchifolius]
MSNEYCVQVPISVTEDYTCPFFHLKYASYKGEGDYQVVNVSAKITASSSEAEKRDVVGLQEQALKEAFEIFCNMGVAGSSSAELLATFCINILKKGGSEKLSDEAIEDTLEKTGFLYEDQTELEGIQEKYVKVKGMR